MACGGCARRRAAAKARKAQEAKPVDKSTLKLKDVPEDTSELTDELKLKELEKSTTWESWKLRKALQKKIALKR